jgi:hypothetical protein
MSESVLAEAFDRLVPPLGLEPDWEDVLERATAPLPLLRNRRVWYALAAAAVLLGLLVSPAFGLGERLVDFFTGAPAPKPVKHELSFGTNVSNSKVDELMHSRVNSKVLTGQARGLMEAATSAGLLRIWGAPTSDGGLCTYMVLLGASHGWLECNTPDPKVGSMIGGADARSAGGKTVRYVSGQAQEEIASVELRLADGSTRRVRMVRPFFFRALQSGEQPVALIGRNRGGDVVERVPARLRFDPDLVLPPTYPVGPGHELYALETEIGAITLTAAPGPDGKRCWTLAAESSELNISCRPVPRGFEFDYGPVYNVEQTRSVVLLSGFVGPRVHSLELHFEDGDSVELERLESYFLYQVPRSRWGKGHRPTVLVARDSEGNVLKRSRVR